ncbi:Pycsar system effector family protein [Pedobacter sp. L105]|uniref:Pycsar system effector family protein n=1 Tax=Pedobacter sp. L105 TaxID=1641871 RepID=UPI00131E5A82|nr:Pycsar system effector family protein [Pedobacter sp. L105]
MTNYLELLDQVRNYTAGLFHDNKDDKLIYHNILHTEQVVKAVVKIANHYQLSDQDFFVVSAAAWFHDIGYLTSFELHEGRGAEAAKVFLTSKGIEPDIIKLVANCILATKMPQHPVGLLEQIVCDADLFHLGSDDFKGRNKLMRKEAEAFSGHDIDKNEWRLKTITLFENHHYHTEYCQELLNAKKELNLQELKDKAVKEEDAHMDKKEKKHDQHDKKHDHKKKHGEEKEEVIETDDKGLAVLEDKAEVKKKKKDRPEKGIETMFRITSGNNQRLSDMADRKAHIMIQTNAIILSVILSILMRKLEDNPHLIIPTLLLLIICVTTMVFSILSTRPTVPTGTFTADDITRKKVNLLFFGNFYKMHLPDYQAGMEQMMEDREFLYGSLIKDVYSQGVVLGRKYRLLRIAYNVFMFGIIIAVLAFMIAIAWVRLQG